MDMLGLRKDDAERQRDAGSHGAVPVERLQEVRAMTRRRYSIHFVDGTTITFDGEPLQDFNINQPIVAKGKENLTIPWVNILFIKDEAIST